MELRYKGNCNDPRDIEKFLKSYYGGDGRGFLDKIRKRLIGRSQGTAGYSQERMEKMGLVGTYELKLTGSLNGNCNRRMDYQGWLCAWNGKDKGWCEVSGICERFSLSPAAASCLDCGGSGKYVGFTTVEDCGTCKGVVS